MGYEARAWTDNTVGLSDNALNVVLKEVFLKNADLKKFLYMKSPIQGMIPKGTFGGKYLYKPYKTGEATGVGVDFGKVFTDVTSNNRGEDFIDQKKIDVDKMYAGWAVTAEQKLRSEKEGPYSYLDVMVRTMRSIGHSMALARINQFFQDGSGRVAKIASVDNTTPTAPVLTLTKPTDVRFLLGRRLQFNIVTGVSTANPTGTLRAGSSGTSVYQIDKIDERTGKLTISYSSGGSGGTRLPAANDWIYYKDARPAAVPAGTTAYCPGLENYVTEVSDFYGLDQTINPGRLTGYNLKRGDLADILGSTKSDRNAKKYKDVILAALARQARTQSKSRYMVCNAELFCKIAIEIENDFGRITRMVGKNSSDNATVGYDALNFVGPGRRMKLVEENIVDKDIIWSYNPDDFIYLSLRQMINNWTFDGRYIDRIQNKEVIYGMMYSRCHLHSSRAKNMFKLDVSKET